MRATRLDLIIEGVVLENFSVVARSLPVMRCLYEVLSRTAELVTIRKPLVQRVFVAYKDQKKKKKIGTSLDRENKYSNEKNK